MGLIQQNSISKFSLQLTRFSWCSHMAWSIAELTLASPPKHGWSMWVSLQLRYGICSWPVRRAVKTCNVTKIHHAMKILLKLDHARLSPTQESWELNVPIPPPPWICLWRLVWSGFHLTLRCPLGCRWPTRTLNWPDFAATPTRLRWPARSRHTVTCMHWFSHILRQSPVPVVWFMSEWRAVTIEQARKICGSTDHFQQFWNGYGRQRVNNKILCPVCMLFRIGKQGFDGRAQLFVMSECLDNMKCRGTPQAGKVSEVPTYDK